MAHMAVSRAGPDPEMVRKTIQEAETTEDVEKCEGVVVCFKVFFNTPNWNTPRKNLYQKAKEGFLS